MDYKKDIVSIFTKEYNNLLFTISLKEERKISDEQLIGIVEKHFKSLCPTKNVKAVLIPLVGSFTDIKVKIGDNETKILSWSITSNYHL
ncbi:MAG: hypothetical protein ACPGFK_00550 [Flavobacteriaceae bacterium]